jgi:hypothetical protein
MWSHDWYKNSGTVPQVAGTTKKRKGLYDQSRIVKGGGRGVIKTGEPLCPKDHDTQGIILTIHHKNLSNIAKGTIYESKLYK